ncbi:hypothetical protein Patl1_32699 [Pistacia atlantica]|uniref:Uncharacterized protein n=1 Tax=Pistacia atlantica TaxID=434234 RepID=A0ACC1ARE9_9ROSI|nr:hypothetical protein Patl1_32699 [Pistacia atlantica]
MVNPPPQTIINTHFHRHRPSTLLPPLPHAFRPLYLPIQNPATGYPPAIGYPPAMGYPPYNPPGFPDPSPDPNSSYDQHHPYQQQHFMPPPPTVPPDTCYTPPYRRQDKGGFPKGMSSGMILLIIFVCFGGLILWIVVRPKFPIFHIDSFYVKNFNVSSNNNFSSSWEGNLTIENKRWGTKLIFDRMQNSIFLNDDDFLASSISEGGQNNPLLVVGSNEKKTIRVKVSTADSKQQGEKPPDKKVVAEMRNKKKSGLTFVLKIYVWWEVDSGLFLKHSRSVQMRMLCTDLKVNFEGNSGNGKMKGNPDDCNVDL